MATTFQYTAVRMGDKNKVQGTITADSERHARELLRNQELYPTSVRPLQAKGTVAKLRQAKKQHKESVMDRFEKIGLKEKVTFTQNMCIMVKSGIPVTEALLYMETYTNRPKFKSMINRIRLDILGGNSLSQALSKHNQVFNEVYVSIVQAGEASGELEAVLKRLTELLLAQAALNKKIMSALIYPAVVVFFVFIALLVSLTFVIPTFAKIYKEMGVDLPLITQMMVWLSDFLLNFWYIALAATAASVFGFFKFRASPVGQVMLDELMLKIPVVSSLIISSSCSYFISTLDVAFSAGLPITDCLMMSCRTIRHSIIRQAFEQVQLQIQAGQRLASALSDIGIMPDMVLVMISTGEESGSLEEMLKFAMEYLEEEVNKKVGIMMSLMEPLLLLVMGGVVAVIALSIYMPLFSIYENI